MSLTPLRFIVFVLSVVSVASETIEFYPNLPATFRSDNIVRFVSRFCQNLENPRSVFLSTETDPYYRNLRVGDINMSQGKYRMNVKGILRCPFSTNNLIRLNFYLNKKSANVTEIRGNTTNLVIIDDTLDIEFKLSVKDSIGGWKDNFFQYKASKACASLKYFFGNSWTPIMTGFGYTNKCPIAVGTHIAKGVDTELLMDSNFPKTFFYGTYKLNFIYSKNSMYYGCFILIVELKRPWEKD